MKKVLLTTVMYFDDEKERQHIIKKFDENWQRLLLPILDSFCSNDIATCFKLYAELPYCDEEGCPGQEFVCMKIADALNGM